jgi:NADH-quinone oxidoreductase subunit N
LNGAFNAIVPMACVTAAGIAAMIAEAFREPGERMPIGGLGFVGLAGAAIASLLLWGRGAVSFGMVAADNFGLFVTMVLVVVGTLSIAISGPTIDREQLPMGEYYALLLFAVAGMILMATATDLLLIFLALEVLSLAVYVLTGIRRQSPLSTEAALKYFLLGAFSSAFFLYGIAFTYGLTGSTRLDRVGSLIAAQAMSPTPMQLLAVGLLLVGFAFKVAAVPFHMWTPDAYEGAPAAVTGFMSTGVKAAAFAAFTRVFLSAFEPLRGDWSVILWGIAAATMIVGTVVGVSQSNVKRMLAYSSIGHGGYLLVAMVAANDVGKGAILFYLLTYAITNLGAFGVIAVLDAGDRAERSGGGLRRAVERTAGIGSADDDLPALARRIPAAGRIHREMVRLQRGSEGRLQLAGDHRRVDQRRLGVFLFAHRGDDVHDAARQRRAGAADAGACRRRVGDFGDPAVLPRHSAGPSARPRRRFHRHNLLESTARDACRPSVSRAAATGDGRRAAARTS